MGNKFTRSKSTSDDSMPNSEEELKIKRLNLIRARDILRGRYSKLKSTENLLKHSPNSKETRKMISIKLNNVLNLLAKKKNVSLCKRYQNRVKKLEDVGKPLKADKQLALLYKCLQTKALESTVPKNLKKTHNQPHHKKQRHRTQHRHKTQRHKRNINKTKHTDIRNQILNPSIYQKKWMCFNLV